MPTSILTMTIMLALVPTNKNNKEALFICLWIKKKCRKSAEKNQCELPGCCLSTHFLSISIFVLIYFYCPNLSLTGFIFMYVSFLTYLFILLNCLKNVLFVRMVLCLQVKNGNEQSERHELIFTASEQFFFCMLLLHIYIHLHHDALYL